MALLGKIVRCCIKFFQWIPVVFINAVILWSYYAYVFILCFENVTSILERTIYLIFYHPFFVMLMVSYWRTIMTELKPVPPQENAKELLERISRNLPTSTRTVSGAVRYCDICNQIKPDRCHHCSMCRKCVLKMDHHCPWVNNCVCFFNYKFFILFLFYAILYTLYVTATVTQYFIAFWKNTLEGDGKLHILFLFFVAVMFCISLWSLFGYHIYLTATNKTTLESFRIPHFISGPDKKGFSLGSAMKNAQQVFGTNKLLWFLPVFTSIGDGIRYPLNHIPEADSLLGNSRWVEEGRYDVHDDIDDKIMHENNHASEINEVNELDPTVINSRPDVLAIQVAPSQLDDDTTL